MRWLRTIARWLLGILVVAMLFGACYELLSRRRVAREFPPPGKLIDIGGRRIHLDCRGAGTPVVVFESGLDVGGSLAWSRVHHAIAGFTRACVYDRAGIMWSDPHDGPQNGELIAQDLHAVLGKAGERPPFVLVGHSLGGPYVMTYTKYFGSEVAGIVFVDASHPDQAKRLNAVNAGRSDPVTSYKIAAALKWTGLVRALYPVSMVVRNNEPAPAARMAMAYAPTSMDAVIKEIEGYDQTLAAAGTFRQLGDRPLFVLTAVPTISDEELAAMKKTRAQMQEILDIRKALHDDEASWSSRSQHEMVPGASHIIPFDRPDVVVAAVRSVVESVRGGR
jgi:pimeloyl-ACP methyl ester carboxylesterase